MDLSTVLTIAVSMATGFALAHVPSWFRASNDPTEGSAKGPKAVIGHDEGRDFESKTTDAVTDPITGIPNRRAVDQELTRRFAEWRRMGRPFSVVLCDVDRSKQLEDTYGYAAVDEVLTELAARFAPRTRKMDLLARFGGEEFAVILPDTRTGDANAVAERLRMAVCGSAFLVGTEQLSVTASFGVATSAGSDESGISIVERADDALDASKQAGGNRGHFHCGFGLMRIAAVDTEPCSDTCSGQLSDTVGSPDSDVDGVICASVARNG